ncbi:acetyl/propionyl/methylcrotonyl-CoA carboxylase subunit alpha [Novosphingobium sp. B 225]|uniref:acetyl/propionyl/methylcrotonyl-CoA carboxylase subunit alpha n=1 Tax=Novosphingobium sp. B 225 TaxID=1961849 RepID=UPI000B4A7DD4|nr:biotin carboxylase N-terminal domain-containing protein [Novosphingobium sp. B 225]
MFSSLLIANRGEIACRIIRTARAMGIRTVAVHSDADARAAHVRAADMAVRIGPAAARESYLVGDRIIQAALDSGAEAIHPGYGFLSENAAFARAVRAAGLIWVGPDPESIEAMGLKDAAKALMQAAGVPVTPGYLGADQSPARLQAEADSIGYPVLIKAVAGGGGKGMRRVDTAKDFADALESCQREAAASFGNDVVLIEKYILSPRHIEVQVFGDSHGHAVHLFERDCSLQRRHQKVIEEAPAPGMDPATRAAVCAAAVQAARAVNYQGAGTIEFIADASEGLRADRVWFMEMNTRLQVEHPVTEAVTGLDLVEWQLRVAAGEPLPLTQDQITLTGHAIEARLYAEDPAKGFLPATGPLDQLWLSPSVRADSGVEQGDVISPFYDPMIAKLIAHAPTRDEARVQLMEALDDSFVAPLTTNKGFLYECLADPDFAVGTVDTGLIARKDQALIPLEVPSQQAADAAAARLRRDWLGWHASGQVRAFRQGLFGFRLNRQAEDGIALWSGEHRVIGNSLAAGTLRADMIGADSVAVTERGQGRVFTFHAPRPRPGAHAGDGAILAPMPGKVIAVDVAAGDRVAKGQRLLVLEAMKMEHALTAPFDGTIGELAAVVGAQVQVEMLLAVVEADPA